MVRDVTLAARFLECKPNKDTLVKCRVAIEQLGEQEPYFSITGEKWVLDSGKWIMDTCGQIEELFDDTFPQIKPYRHLHCRNLKGIPMHFISNLRYHLDRKDSSNGISHLGCRSEEFGAIMKLYEEMKTSLCAYRDFYDVLYALTERWEREAKEFMKWLNYKQD